jgi:hypothetical protein
VPACESGFSGKQIANGKGNISRYFGNFAHAPFSPAANGPGREMAATA